MINIPRCVNVPASFTVLLSLFFYVLVVHNIQKIKLFIFPFVTLVISFLPITAAIVVSKICQSLLLLRHPIYYLHILRKKAQPVYHIKGVYDFLASIVQHYQCQCQIKLIFFIIERVATISKFGGGAGSIILQLHISYSSKYSKLYRAINCPDNLSEYVQPRVKVANGLQHKNNYFSLPLHPLCIDQHLPNNM